MKEEENKFGFRCSELLFLSFSSSSSSSANEKGNFSFCGFCLRFGGPRAGHFHVNVVQVYGYCVVEGREGIVMELCHGDLSEHLWRHTRGPAGTARGADGHVRVGAGVRSCV